MVFIGAAILPHGTMPFDGDPNSASAKCSTRNKELLTTSPTLWDSLSKIYNGTCNVAERIASLDPDLIILLSPHAISITNHYLIYVNNVAKGNCLWNDEWSEFQVTVNIDTAKAQELIRHLNVSVDPTQCVEGLKAFTATEAPLRWGEAVPLWYLKKYLKKDLSYIIMSQELGPLTDEPESWRLQLGRGIAGYISQLKERVVVVISGDLSHYYPTDCTDPLYLPDPRWNMKVDKEVAESYESLVCQWVKAADSYGLWEPTVARPLLDHLVRKSPLAGCCCIKGFVVLQALLDGIHQNGVKVRPTIDVCCAPTYYGMMAASFIAQN